MTATAYLTDITLLTCLAACAVGQAVFSSPARADQGQAEPIRIDLSGLPPRSVMELRPERPIPEWLQTHVRIGHLPPDFLEYPAQIVDEVEFLDSIAPSVRDEIESRRKKEERNG